MSTAAADLLVCLPCWIARTNPGFSHTPCGHHELHTGVGRCQCPCPEVPKPRRAGRLTLSGARQIP